VLGVVQLKARPLLLLMVALGAMVFSPMVMVSVSVHPLAAVAVTV
jgi:hypothetical protein